MDKHLLSKSSFLRGLQCAKALFLYKNYYHLKDPPGQEKLALFNRGNAVGKLAQQLFPGGVDLTWLSASKVQDAVLKTQQLIQEGTKIIYEAAFQYEQALCIIDILVNKNDKWYAYEVKSSAKVSGHYIMDASFQYYVITRSGLPLANISIVHLNTAYIKKGPLELKKLFKPVSILKEVLNNQAFIHEKVLNAKQVVLNDKIPEIAVGTQCFEPYACDYTGHCWKNTDKTLFEIAGMHKHEQFQLYNEGIRTVYQIPEDYPLKKLPGIQVKSMKEKREFVDKEAIRGFLKTISYPVYFVDFETFMPAIPIYEGTSPYQNIPFQFSIHYKKDKENELEHKEFLADAGLDPRRQFVAKFLEVTEAEGVILAYSIDSEKNILKDLKRNYPEYTEMIDERIGRMKDLMTPFKELWYYTPAMKGSHSIKNVLPALVPELSYKALPINNGNMASVIFESLQKETDIYKIAEKRDALLEYCKMDTYAMVKIVEVLETV